MHNRTSPIAYFAIFAALTGALAFGYVPPALADSHLPIVDLVPTSSWTLTSDGIAPNGGPQNPSATNGTTELDGSVTLPLAKGLSIGFNRTSLGAFDSSLSSVTFANGKTFFPGGARDYVQSYVVDYKISRFNIEGGLGARFRQCCPAGSFEWHKGFLGVSYATPSLDILNHGFFVLDITGNSYHHFSSPDALASIPAGLSLPNKQVYTTQQSVTAVVPIDPKHGVRTAFTYLWGALDYPINAPFPLYYGVFIMAATKQVTPEFGLTATVLNVIQRNQGTPFSAPVFAPGSTIRTAALNVAADFHIDFNKIFAQHAPAGSPGRPVTPGVPGGPGGPAQVGPSQGGTVSPAPSPAPTTKP